MHEIIARGWNTQLDLEYFQWYVLIKESLWLQLPHDTKVLFREVVVRFDHNDWQEVVCSGTAVVSDVTYQTIQRRQIENGYVGVYRLRGRF